MDVKKFCTENAVFTLTVNNLATIDQQKLIGCICCDVAEAFDCVSHIILQGKLYYYDTHGINSHWLQSYPVNRKQNFEIILQNHEHFLPDGEQYVWCSPGIILELFFYMILIFFLLDSTHILNPYCWLMVQYKCINHC
jgi:hypothetical protein